MSQQERVARRVVVHGDVQGVFFRDTCRREAESRGVTGWVENRYDGTVEAVFAGPPDAVGAMVDWARSGPRRAHVQHVDVHETEPPDTPGFQVR